MSQNMQKKNKKFKTSGSQLFYIAGAYVCLSKQMFSPLRMSVSTNAAQKKFPKDLIQKICVCIIDPISTKPKVEMSGRGIFHYR